MSIRIDGTNTTANPGITGGDADTGLQFGTDEVKIVTGGTDRVTVDSSGNLGIGTTSPSESLEVSGNGLKVSGQSSGITDEGITFDWDSGSNNGRIFSESAGSSNLLFYTTNSGTRAERMRIDNAGKVGIGQTSFSGDGEKLGVKGDTNTFNSYCVRFINSDGTVLFRVRNDGRFITGVDGQSPFNLTTASGANVFVGSDGTLHRSTSSARFKTEVEDLEDEYADRILNLRPVWYRSSAPGDQLHKDWSYYGFIAEEVAAIDPRFVFWTTHETILDNNGVEVESELEQPIADGVQYDRLVPHLLNLIKRQKEQIEAQGTAIAALETRLTALEGGAS